ncbi:BREX-1 system adenine-specific DNA-methyltransferase PglX [Globicatella sulfidifaciens]|uniref:site-specific DNA-methyltransferase (adenine-specific) n=1 Tax=Globicatella sulfidifaciens TaxID=136093 RepID=A0A7X8H169_9LACT|nr:BREX-1 system adenine-specific DNA-methyltransferase PglX [Globicatella sulfidifaciens]NLJ19483.1 BREX-1 system adenine-specific DNA-methyltransferase PglX [Globicatella sulfidifaciens]
MNKSALKNFATEARIELLEKVELQARKLGVTAESIQEANVESSDAVFIDGKQLSDIERRQRNKLIARINEIGFNRVMEETAYTWFNRFIALRYMEVNDYLPTKVRVLSSEIGSAEPDMMKEALSLDLDLDKEKVYEMKMNNETDELFKYLIKMHCNDLNHYMPFMFEKIEDYTEILFPEGLLGTDSFVRKMTDTEVIPEDNWKKIEVIGWLYQYYIADEKDRVFADLKKNIKITKDTLPAATQLFTPNWIVRYMVENSLGRIWLESYPESSLRNDWEYYLEEAEQEDEVIKQLEEIRYKNVNPEEITFLDPCCGSGHILVYAFDVFYELYLEKGYIENEIPKLILEKNIYGLDVDDRAVQLASFALMMKARSRSRRVFKQEIKLNICSIQESDWLSEEVINYFAGDESIKSVNDNLYKDLIHLKSVFKDAKEYGSIVDVKQIDFECLENRLHNIYLEETDLLNGIYKNVILEKFPAMFLQTKILTNRYDVVCTNPPYMGNGRMGKKLNDYVKLRYPNSKTDLSTVFMEKTLSLCEENGYMSMINIPVWMSLAGCKELRLDLIDSKTIINMIHFGRGVFGSDFGTVSFVFRNVKVDNYLGTYRRLFFKQGAVDSLEQKKKWFFEGVGHFNAQQEKFKKIPSFPFSYWISKKTYDIFNEFTKIGHVAEAKQGLITGNNDRFLRFWHEINIQRFTDNCKSREETKVNNVKWYPYNKGGDFRKWYGNNNYVVNWENDGYEIQNFKGPNGKLRSRPQNLQYYFSSGLTWTALTAGIFSMRYSPKGFLFDAMGPVCFPKDSNNTYFILGLLNSVVADKFLKILSPNLKFDQKPLENVPFPVKINHEVDELVKQNIKISKNDWDNFETSWEFKVNPLIKFKGIVNKNIRHAFLSWEENSNKEFEQLKSNEEKLNQIFIDIYGLEDELSYKLDSSKVTIRKADLESDIKSFISYAIGCSFGRYSLDEEGLIYAGGEFDPSRYQTFPADEDNILPVLSGAYFEDDIVTRFIDFVRVTFSEETLEENLNFVADALGRRKNETAREAIRRYFLNDFYKDHVQVYKKRPIYWLFTSGKEKAFNCLIYMHRYDKTTLSRIRTDYLHEVQTRMDAEKNDLLEIINGDSTTREINSAKRELKSLDRKIDELKKYDELLHHMADMQIEIDLDDGVKVNYEKFKGLVAKI